ncbi:MAG: hypothetical protein ABIO45_15955 [Burkholderiaceae bacterium]
MKKAGACRLFSCLLRPASGLAVARLHVTILAFRVRRTFALGTLQFGRLLRALRLGRPSGIVDLAERANSSADLS